jgi:acyl-CoA synthetase (AMP-forming)/AMP-acid ligase II/thioesterase domain-containing protein/acyl carrier protein
MGVGRGDVVASVLPNGPDAATVVLGVPPYATLALLNPDAQAAEYSALFRELEPKILLTAPGQAQPAREAAREIDLPVVEVVAGPEAGAFAIRDSISTGKSSNTGKAAQSGDVAFIIATSGSTAHPKLIPLTHRVVCSIIRAVVEGLPLTPGDRCLNFSPLFHLLGFNVSVLVPIGGGGSVVCAHPFNTHDFFRWLDEFRPTWFAAVPTILLEILDHVAQHREILERSTIRFLRSGGAPLPAPVAERIEAAFGAPLLRVYGLSEAPSITMDSIAGVRRSGSCGCPTCNEVEIVDGDGRRVPPGQTGEVVVRGPGVIDGYFRNPALTQAAFRDGWFHTGDIGYFDAGQHLFLTGRASEFINRGGEKISPVEVDEVLMGYSAVAEAVTFPMPHDKLGEEVAAAVVLRDGASATEGQLQEFAATRLAAHKVPRCIVFVNRLPVGPTGKVQRSRIREYLTLPAGEPGGTTGRYAQPRDERERRIAARVAEVLRVERVGIHDSFFDLGGDSLKATECTILLRKEFGIETLNPGVFIYAPTVARLAEIIANPTGFEGAGEVLPIQPHGDGIPLFWIAPGFEAPRVARHMGERLPVFGVPIPEAAQPRERSIHEMAAECVPAVRRFRRSGPYALVGWCAAGVVALEVARQLEQECGEVAFVAILDVRNPFLPPLSPWHLGWVKLWRRLRRLMFVGWHWPVGLWNRFLGPGGPDGDGAVAEVALALFRHQPQPWSGRMVHIWAAQWPHGRYFDPGFGWNHLAPAGFVFHEVPGDHLTMLQEPNVAEVARLLAEELNRAQRVYEKPLATVRQ